MRVTFLSITIFLCVASCALAVTTHCVDANSANPVSPYTSWATAATNIQDAVNASSDGDLVLVTNGIYASGGQDVFGNNRVAVTHAITIQSVNGPAATVIKGVTNSPNVRCVFLTNGAALVGFTLTNGASGGSAGGVLSSGFNNSSISNCLITGNVALDGGGGVSGVFYNCTFTGNSANSGGAIFSATMYNCLVSSNSAGNGGGCYSGTAYNCSFIGNIAGNGGGGYNSFFQNCLFTGNVATGSFGGGAAYQSSLENCTVVANRCTSFNGGTVGGALNCGALISCILFNNTSLSHASTPNYSGGGFLYNCCTTPLPAGGSGNFNSDPMLVNQIGGDFHLQSGSPCINAGNNTYATSATDLDGNARIIGGTVDVGAYEYQPPIHYVSISNTTPVLPFTNWLTAATNIQDAIDASVAGDFIVVSNGIYQSGGRVVFGTMTNRVVVDKAVTVQSVNGPTATVIAGLPGTGAYFSTGYRCVYMTNGAALIGFTLTNGATRAGGTDATNEQSGAGVWCVSTNAFIINCSLLHCYANNLGGGAYQGTLSNCVISGDTAFISGGGTYRANLNNCIVSSNKLVQGSGGGGAAYGVLNNCLITSNAAYSGGGTYYSILNSCVVSNNSATFGGGVAFGVINGSLISSNRASSGGGAYSNTLVNCILKNNFAGGIGGGGGAYNSSLVNCTVVSNTAGFNPAPAESAGGGVFGGTLTNCIIYYNSVVGNGSNSLNSVMSYCDTLPLSTNGFGNITNEPAFVDLANGDFHLQSNSPCINSGDNTYITGATDFDGNPRIADGTVDIGAYEFQSPQSIISYAYLQQYGLPTDGSGDYADSDGDGMNNWQEWRAQTSPVDVSSLLEMLSPTPTNNSSGVTVTWQSVSGVNYFVQRGSDLSAQPIFSTIQSNIVGQAGTTSFTDTTATNPIPYFYRVGVQ